MEEIHVSGNIRKKKKKEGDLLGAVSLLKAGLNL